MSFQYKIEADYINYQNIVKNNIQIKIVGKPYSRLTFFHK